MGTIGTAILPNALPITITDWSISRRRRYGIGTNKKKTYSKAKDTTSRLYGRILTSSSNTL
jgi:hypothetical protein